MAFGAGAGVGLGHSRVLSVLENTLMTGLDKGQGKADRFLFVESPH